MKLPFLSTHETAATIGNATDQVNTNGHQQDLYNMLMQAPVAIVVFSGPEYVIELTNDLYLPIAGKSREELLNKPAFEAMPIAAAQGFIEILDNIRHTGELFRLEEHETLIERKGQVATAWLNIVYQPLKEADGFVSRIMILVTDVTEQVEARRKKEESEQRFQAAISAVQGILWTNNAEGQMQGEQLGWAGLTGQSYEEYQGYGWAAAIHPEDANPTINAWNDAVTNLKPFVFEHRLRVKNGCWNRFSVRAIPLLNEDGTIREWVGVHTNITEQRQAEEALKDSEELFRNFSNNITNLAWMADGEGWIYWYNERWYEYTGTTLEEMQGWGWGKVHHPDYIDGVVNFVKQAWKRDSSYELTFPLKGKDGQYRWYLTRVVPIKNSDGKVVRWVGTNTDIHDQKTMEEKLEGLVAKRTQELNRSNEDLQQFAHVASHDLKEPVRKIKTFGSRLVAEFGEKLPEQAKFYVSKIEAAASRMYSMIDGVLTYSTIDITEVQHEPVNLNEVLRDVESDLELVIGQKNAIIQYKDLPTIEGIPILLHQLFYNLINNALKFSKADKEPFITLKAKFLKEEKGKQSGLTGKEYEVITIQDNGIGFKQNQAEQIFKTFSRLNTKDKYEGTGLGLALCKKIVERHGGRIEAEAKEGEGAIFTIYLPVHPFE